MDLDQGTYKRIISSPLKPELMRCESESITQRKRLPKTPTNLPDVLPIGATIYTPQKHESTPNETPNNIKVESNEPRTPLLSPVFDNTSPKYTSQSSVDLKKIQMIPTLDTDSNESVINDSHTIDEKIDDDKNGPNNNENVTPTVIDDGTSVLEKESMERITNDIDKISLNENEQEEKVEESNGQNSSFNNETNISSLELCVPSQISLEQTHMVLSELSIQPIRHKQDEPKILQKTEIILRLNAPTSEAASQTDGSLIHNDERDNENMHDSHSKILAKSNLNSGYRQKLMEEIECDKLSKDLISHLSPTDKLYNILGMHKRVTQII